MLTVRMALVSQFEFGWIYRYGPSRALIVSASKSSTACLYDLETPSRVPASP